MTDEGFLMLQVSLLRCGMSMASCKVGRSFSENPVQHRKHRSSSSSSDGSGCSRNSSSIISTPH
jgi:hypothetical protein